MISGVSSVISGGYTSLSARSLVLALTQNRPDRVNESERVDRPEIEEYYRVRFDTVSLGGVAPQSARPRTPIERYLEIAAL